MDVSGLPSSSSQKQTTPDPAFRPRQRTPSSAQASPASMSLVGESLQRKGISERAETIILQSWRQGTQKQYQVYIKKWINFAERNHLDPLQVAVGDVLDFLVELYDSGLSYSGINTARSALSSCVTIPGCATVGTHPLIKRFVKAVYQTRPDFPRYQSTWDTSIVLHSLEGLHPLDKLSLKDLTLKVVMLVALVTGQRGQSIFLMDLNHMTENKNSYKFLIQEKVRQSAPGRPQPVLMLTAFPANIKLCIVKTLMEYLKRTKDLRQPSKLFISYIAPFQAASRDTISRWIKVVMIRAGIDVEKFKPHSTRAASASAAHRAKIPLQTILKTAGWSNQ